MRACIASTVGSFTAACSVCSGHMHIATLALMLALPLGVADGAVAGRRTDGQPNGATPPPIVATAEEIDGLIEMLKSRDQTVSHAAAERLLAIGEPALPAIEAAFAARRLLAMGQPKIVLMALRERRTEREWNERLDALHARPVETRMLLRQRGRANGTVSFSIAPLADATTRGLAFTATIEPADRTPSRTVTAELALDRTLSVRSVTTVAAPPAGTVASATIEERRLRGIVGERTVDAVAPPPMALDWALPVLATLMPQAIDADLYMTVLDHESLSVSATASLRCVAIEPATRTPERPAVYVYELLREGAAPVRVKVQEHSRRIVEVMMGDELTLTLLPARAR